MKIVLAKKMGFCYGVKRAIKIAEETGKSKEKAVTLGPIIHNPQVVNTLQKQGVGYVDDLEQVNQETIIIRSHGVGPSCYNKASEKNLKIIDATCPFVLRAQKEAHRLVKQGKQVIIFGEKNHPEVKSIAEWALGKAFIAETPNDLLNLPLMERVSIVSQTTFSRAVFQEMLRIVSEKATYVDIHETICNATTERQEAVIEMAAQVDVIIVIGGKNSGNTRRLAEVSRKEGMPTYHIETAAELKQAWFRPTDRVGITAGASTPDWIIEEVLVVMEDMNKSFEEMEMDYDYRKGSIVEGTVVAVTDEEAFVSFGYKTEAQLRASEYAFPEPKSMKDVLQVGDEVKGVIISAVKEDNPIFISKIRFDRIADWEIVEKAIENDEPVMCEATEAIKAGLLVQIQSLRGFIPLSQGDLRFVRSLSFLVGTKFPAKVLEVDRLKNRLVLSRKAVLEESRDEGMESLKSAFENGTVLTGVVKKIMPYGAFVDVNGIEGLLHISDVSWNKIDKVEDLLEQNQEIEVKIKSFDEEKNRISFTHKDTMPDPWHALAENYTQGDIATGKVVKVMEFGAIVELKDGLTGLLHVSEITKDRSEKASDRLQEGDMVEVHILKIDPNKKRIGFSLVQVAKSGETDEESDQAEEVTEAE